MSIANLRLKRVTSHSCLGREEGKITRDIVMSIEVMVRDSTIIFFFISLFSLLFDLDTRNIRSKMKLDWLCSLRKAGRKRSNWPFVEREVGRSMFDSK